MKTSHHHRRTFAGFTLIELLVVIAVIAILAGLLLTGVGKMMQTAAKKRAKTELEQVASAIDSYKAKLGYYPPDNTNNYAANTLYFELAGCRRTGNTFVTLDGLVGATDGILFANFRASGIMNSSANSGSDDSGASAQSFLKEIKPGHFGERVAGSARVRALGTQVDGSVSWPPQPVQAGDISINPFRYNSSNPTNNPNSYDLWVDIVVGGKTNRISNWSPKPQVL